jgi:hypothetical protein
VQPAEPKNVVDAINTFRNADGAPDLDPAGGRLGLLS